MDIAKIAAIALIGIISSALLKGINKDYSIYIIIATIIIILMLILEKLVYVFDFIEVIYSQITYGKNYFPIILKVLAVAYITDFTSQLCLDVGEGSIATKVELAGKIFIFYLSIPIIISILQLINTIL